MIVIGKQHFNAQHHRTPTRSSKIDRRRLREQHRLPMEIAAVHAQLQQLGRF